MKRTPESKPSTIILSLWQWQKGEKKITAVVDFVDCNINVQRCDFDDKS